MCSLVAAVVFPFDRVLAGMVAAGLGVEGICLYLGVSPDALDESLVRLGLRTPHNRPLRKQGARGWPVFDTTRLIAWRATGIHPATIGERLGRSANAVRTKARRLGIPVPDRRSLRRVDPATLADPLPGFAFGAAPSRAAAQDAAPATPGGSGTTGRPTALLGGDPHRVVPLRPAPAVGETASLEPVPPVNAPPAKPAVATTCTVPAQQGAPILRIIPDSQPVGSPPTPVPAAVKIPVVADHQPVPSLPITAKPTASAPISTCDSLSSSKDVAARKGALEWIAGIGDRRRNREVVMALALRYFSGQAYKATAAEAGITASALQSFYYHIELPRDRHRSKFGDTFDEDLARANFEKSGYELVQCRQKGFLFFRHRKDRAIVTVCREVRRERGLLDEFSRYQSAPLCL